MEFKNALAQKDVVITVEYNPPRGLQVNLSNIREVSNIIDGVNVTDCPMASLRMSSIVASYIIQNEIGLPTIFNLTCRDRNVLALQSDLLGAWSLGLRSVLAIGGDAIKNVPERNVYHTNTYQLIKLISNLNNGKNIDNQNIDSKTDFFIGVASNVYSKFNSNGIRNRLKRKCEIGSKFVITQPIYSIESLDYFLEASKDIDILKIIGIFPITNIKTALYLNKYVQGISIPKELISRLESAKDQKIEGFRFEESVVEKIVKRGYAKEIKGMHLMRFNKEFVKFVYNAINGS